MKKKVVLSVTVVLLLVMIAVMCVACTPNADNVKKKLEDKGYKVQVVENPKDEPNVTKSLVAYKNEISLTALVPDLAIAWYKDSKSAKKGLEETQKGLDDLKSIIGTDTYQVKRKGNAVIMGTKEALKLV